MKRDMELVRQILLDATDNEHGYAKGNPVIDGYTEDQISHHIYLMKQAGLVEALEYADLDSTSPKAHLMSVTWKGHDFIEAARSNTIWAQAKEKAGQIGGSMTFDLMKDLLVSLARKSLDL